jgi:UDP-N-acetylmuramate dehydrogenase
MILENASLRAMNTFGIDARARWLVRVRDPDVLPTLLTRREWRDLPLLVLGEGSNVLFVRDFDGVVLRIDASRIAEPAHVDGHHLVHAEAGGNWHEFVRWSLARGFSGLENLSLIPGTVGAAPIQNIGAYGVELAPRVASVDVFDRAESSFATLSREECGFDYRHSVFKGAAGGRYIVLGVNFTFAQDGALALDYPGVRGELAAIGAGTPTAALVSEAICRIRRRKLPDPRALGNAGSFFKNPVVTADTATVLAAEHADMPQFPAGDGWRKLSAAWLIDQLGFKGVREGDAGVAPTHALVLVNHGHASGAEIWALAMRIRDAVRARFGVTLEPEPYIVD